jgi:hypothetical protein
MKNESLFIRATAVMAVLSAITTFLLWLLPNLFKAPASFEEGILLTANKYYIGRLWINFIHIPLALGSYFGLMMVLFKQKPLSSTFGMLWFLVWGIIELVGISIIIFSVNFNWRTNYPAASEIQKNIYKASIESFYSIWDSMFFVLLTAFLIASICFSLATSGGKRLQKFLNYLLWFSVPLTVLIMLNEYAHQEWAGKVTRYFYPALQPASRFIMGLFIWKKANDSGRL